LTRSQAARAVIQDYVPLCESLEWLLGQRYLKDRGSAAFTVDSSPVPFVVNNDGTLSRHAAEVFFQSLAVSDQQSAISREQDIIVLELGVGVGLFARFFLDHFRELARKHKKDYYDRLSYVLGDKSPRMLLDVSRHGILAGHAGHYRLRVVDAMQVDECLPYDIAFPCARRTDCESVAACRTDCESVPQRQTDGLTIRPTGKKAGPFRAVFLNYLLDCLPAAVLELRSVDTPESLKLTNEYEQLKARREEIGQLYVRTCLARNVNLADFTDMTAEQLRERAKSSDPRAQQELLEVYGLFASEYEYRVLEMKNEERRMKNEELAADTQSPSHSPLTTNHSPIPYLDFALNFARGKARRLLHSYGAIQCLEKLLGLVADDGFILINDYGQTEITLDDDFEHQRFSLATFVGVNFPLLKAYFSVRGEGRETRDEEEAGSTVAPQLSPLASRPSPLASRPSPLASRPSPLASRPSPLTWDEPFGGDAGGIHSRLLSRNVSREASLRFQACFGRAEFDRIHEPVNKARECVKAGRFEAALTLYRQGLQRQPGNWLLLSEVANFVTFSMGDPKAGADLAKLALRLNPACSSDLWCTLGDALFEWGRTAEAKSAYLRALKINPGDVRGRFNLAFVHTRQKNYAAALVVLAEALALDKTGQYRERVLQKQAEVLQLLAGKNQAEFWRMVNLVSKPKESVSAIKNEE
jgi:tetratricopeptide (TPR) repeat protein